MGKISKKDDIKTRKTKLTLGLQKHFEEMLRAEIRWNRAFGKTYRYNGTIVDGNPRNTIDTRNSFKKLRIDITNKVNLKVSIRFLDKNAKYIFGEDGHRSEYFDYALNKLSQYLAKQIVALEIETRLGSKSENIQIPLQKATIKRTPKRKTK